LLTFCDADADEDDGKDENGENENSRNFMTFEHFHAWVTNRDRVHRLELFKLTPDAFAEDDLILVQPSTGLHRKFADVLAGVSYIDLYMQLVGLSRNFLIEPNPDELPSQELMLKNFRELTLLSQLLQHCFGINTPFD
jgi:hypothetical protein